MGMPASTKQGGMCFGFPDVCKTPAGPNVAPIPYPNMAQLTDADGAVDKVLIDKKEVLVEDSKISRSSGDEAGTLKGVVSSTNMDEVAFKQSSSKVYFGGKKAVYHTVMTAHNGSNANMPAGLHVSPSQTKVMVGM